MQRASPAGAQPNFPPQGAQPHLQPGSRWRLNEEPHLAADNVRLVDYLSSSPARSRDGDDDDDADGGHHPAHMGSSASSAHSPNVHLDLTMSTVKELHHYPHHHRPDLNLDLSMSMPMR